MPCFELNLNPIHQNISSLQKPFDIILRIKTPQIRQNYTMLRSNTKPHSYAANGFAKPMQTRIIANLYD